MLKIEFTVSNALDAARAARIASAIAAEYDEPEATAAVATTPAPRRGRPPTAPKADPVAAYTAAGGTLPPVTAVAPVQETPAAVAPVQDTPATPATPATPTPSAFDRESALARVREEAQLRGATWLREVLTLAKAGKLSEMTDDQLAGTLSALDAAAALNVAAA